jgi:hypothetical protein
VSFVEIEGELNLSAATPPERNPAEEILEAEGFRVMTPEVMARSIPKFSVANVRPLGGKFPALSARARR